MTKCRVPFLDHCDLDLVSRIGIDSVAYLLYSFEVGILNLVCEYVLGWRSVTYHFWVTVTLSSDLVFRIIVYGAYLLHYLIGMPNLVCGCILGWRSVAYHFGVTVTLTSYLVSRIGMGAGVYLLYSLR